MRAFALMLVLLMSGCVSPVVVDHRAGTDYSRYQTYAIDPPSGDSEMLSLDGQRVQQAVKETLANGPLKAADKDQADLLLRYQFTPVERFSGNTFSFGLGFWRNNYGLSTSTPVEGETEKEYRLQLALVEPGSKEVVWQATSRDTLYLEMNSQHRLERINAMVTEMFKRYPPGASAK
ncbi:DUF4136 domain-containing protein [Alloalcanivorax mobilis]|uniref:DUF4136 domain-containing protein n=1 Tax=Alloalcanivorax mobilis TaxID=2019569 RepID=UPI0013000952|nr:DUF4136 domain-containing protein [Alloalcanivorax mobilis]|tara:strand:- start:33735 stop:34265 length:531 start_codon:yes stop_codon:yes gene_type:complete